MKKKFIIKDSGKRKDFKSGMRRDTDEGKPRYDLIYLPMMKRLAELHARGVIKYGEKNWENANSIEELNRFKASAFRLFMSWIMEEDDEEDHASSCIFNINATEFVKNKLYNTINK